VLTKMITEELEKYWNHNEDSLGHADVDVSGAS